MHPPIVAFLSQAVRVRVCYLLLFIFLVSCGRIGEGPVTAPKPTALYSEVTSIGKECGVESRTPSGQGYAPDVRECIWQAYKDGLVAGMLSHSFNKDGSPVNYVLIVGAQNRVTLNVDDHSATGGDFVRTLHCQSLARLQAPLSGQLGFVLSECEGDGSSFIFR